MANGPQLVQVIIPLAVEGVFTYAVPSGLEGKISRGARVLVPFGKKRHYAAVVMHTRADLPRGVEAKEIIDLLDPESLVSDQQLQLWEWMWSYYMCTPGEVMRAALPSGLRPESESRVRPSHAWEDDGSLDHYERLLFEVIREEGELSMAKVELSGVGGNPLRVLKQLVDLGAVEINEFYSRVVKTKKQSFIAPGPELKTEQDIHMALDSLRRAPRQLELLERFLQLLEDAGSAAEIPRNKLLDGEGLNASLGTLLKKGILQQSEKELADLSILPPGKTRSPYPLNPLQEKALDDIKKGFSKYQSVLLHGVTSSGKTEIYTHLIAEEIKAGRQVLYLLPEIGLTAQIIMRMREVFGAGVGIYHSRYSDRDRVHVYRNLKGLTDEEPYKLVIGVRSALFLPFSKLGLVIIDEEHEHTFKQYDPAPRYHARDSAQVLALYHGAHVLLGTATPAFESHYNARQGKFGYVSLARRFGEVETPEIILANTKEARHRKQMRSFFTPQLVKAIEEALAKQEQVILFQNRRGYSNFIVCESCGDIPKCRRCDVSLTFHRASRKLECHYCGHKEEMPGACKACGSTSMRMHGFGTEKIEEELPLVFEGIRVGRLDTDTARSRKGFEKVLRDFDRGALDVLVGTQMITKGLDFEKVSLVGILDADSMLHFPDFRAFERSFQLMAQVSGRAGRRKKRGKVIIQTSDPGHPVIQQVERGDYEGLYSEQMEERQMFHYPPFTRMIRLEFRHKISSILDGGTALLASELREIFGNRVFGPQYPPVRKIHDVFHKHIILKIERGASYERAKIILGDMIRETFDTEVYRAIRVAIDVDPY